ncbi:MAG: SHOCT domain-containing protein, partial [Treponema sp.]|nr:SHOCT domain-containing protein [Treponema sp.]
AQSITLAGRALGTVKSAFSAVTDAVNDTINAYNVQATAEKQLEAAAKNNPFLSDYSVQQLKAYAGELQSISTTGDEELLPMMAQLAAAGRTQSEIQDIMSASLDISASGAMSLESAVRNLNKTYGGLSGELGETNPKIKALTTEQLKNGEAVKIMKEQYSGMAKTVSDSTGGWQQFKNTFGDLKETIGSTFANLQNQAGKVLNSFFGSIIEKLQSAGKEADEFKRKFNIADTIKDDKASIADLEGIVSELEKQAKRIHDIEDVALGDSSKVKDGIIKDAKDTLSEIAKERAEIAAKSNDTVSEYNRLQLQIEKNAADFRTGKITREAWKQTDELLKAEQVRVRDSESLVKAELAQYDEANRQKIESSNAVIRQAEKEVESLKRAYGEEFLSSYAAVAAERKKIDSQLAEAQRKLAEAQKKASKEAGKKAAEEADEKALSIIRQNTAELNKNIEAIRQKYALMESEGQKIDDVAMQQEILNAKENAYLKLISEDTTLVTKNNAVAKARLADIQQGFKKVEKALKDSKALKDYKDEMEKLSGEAREFVAEIDQIKLSERIGDAISKTRELRDSTEQGSEAWQTYNEKIDELLGLLAKVKEKENELDGGKNRIQQWAREHEKKFEIAEQFAAKYGEIMSGISDLMIQNAENEATAKQAALEEQLANGEISEEEYAEKKKQIEKETADAEYKAQMWAWGANLINIQAQMALAVVKALSEGGPYAGPAM